MAGPKGLFSKLLVPEGWFSQYAQPKGWFNEDLLETPATGGANDIAGSTSLSFTLTATLAGLGDLQGSTSLTFAPTGTLIGRGSIAGSTSLTFTTTATLAGTGALAGSTSLTFALTGTLTDAAAGVDNIAGSTSLTFSLTGTLSSLEGQSEQPSGGSYKFLNPRVPRYEDEPEPPRKRARKVKKGPVVVIDTDNPVVTGIVELTALKEGQERRAAEQKRQAAEFAERRKRNIARSNQWLLMA